MMTRLAALAACLTISLAHAAEAPTKEGDFSIPDFRFAAGETLPTVRIHYTTLGQPTRDAAGHVNNAVLILHGTGGSGGQFLRPQFSGVLFQPGAPLDPATYFIILPDDIGHGKSSKPSDGLRARFPHYDYTDMVELERRLVVDGLKIDHLRLIIGTSMGCMHAFLWGEARPDFMDALMPLACLPVPIAGRNRMWRKMIIDAIREDPAWAGGDYSTQPPQALRTVADILLIAGSAPIQMQKAYPTREAAETYLEGFIAREVPTLDANDTLYQLDASRNYDPSPKLESITAPVLWINSADDFINPPELGIAEREAKRLKHGSFVLLPPSEQTHGHGTHTWAAVWQERLAGLLAETAR